MMGNNMSKEISQSTFNQKIEEFPLNVPICVDHDSPLGAVIIIMQENRFGSVLVTNQGKLAGIITERDILLKVIGIIENWKEIKVCEIMTKDPISLTVDDPVVSVLNHMNVGGFRHLPIVNEHLEPINMISIKDAINFVLGHM